jgi:hypothetical protein
MPSPEDASVLQAYFEGVDERRIEADRKWGCGRLEMLVEGDLLARWRRQCFTWREALEAAWKSDFLSRDALQLVQQKAAAMQRGWQALDTAAEEAGHRPVAPWVWEIRLEDGTVAALVQTNAEASKVIHEGRYVVVYTAAEIGALIDLLPGALQLAKVVFPGARLQPSATIHEPIPWDDPIPFGEGEAA